jgi:protease-4
MMHPNDTKACFASHMGLWAMHIPVLQNALYALQQGFCGPQAQVLRSEQDAAITRTQGKLYSQTPDGTAIIRIVGTLTKGWGKFSDTSTVMTRQAIRQALADDKVGSILLAVDSGGGHVAGVADLADDVRKATQRKPVAAYYEDLAASAAVWATVHAQRITANPTAEVGSIGVFAVLQDMSGAAEREGVSVRVVSTGPYKGLGVSGTPISQELCDEVQNSVNQIGQFFFHAVQQGRQLTQTRLDAVSDGRVWIAAAAQERGLIDGIETFEEALIAVARLRPRRRMAAEQRQASLRAAREGLQSCL